LLVHAIVFGLLTQGIVDVGRVACEILRLASDLRPECALGQLFLLYLFFPLQCLLTFNSFGGQVIKQLLRLPRLGCTLLHYALGGRLLLAARI
jgi:hypothetical protein